MSAIPLRITLLNDIINKLLLEGDQFMPEMHLRQPGFTYSACGPFTMNKEIVKKYKQTGDPRYIYKNELDKGSDVPTLSSKSAIKSTPQNKQLAEELHKPIIKKFKKSFIYSAFRENIWGAHLADMQLIGKFNKGFRFLLGVIDIYGKYTWVVPLKDKKRCKYC